MAIVKVIEVIAGSDKSFDDAVRNALSEAKRTVKNIRSIYVQEMKANVENGEITSFGVNAKISFEVEH
jgi:dodecin